MKRSLLIPALFLSAAALVQADEFRVFTNTQGATIKAKFVSAAAGQVTIVREDGRQFVLPIASLSPADQQFIQQQSATAPTAAVPTPAAPVGGMKAMPGPNDKLSPDEVNAAAGQPMFAETSIWDMTASELAQKLNLKPESKTKDQSSYRSYPGDDVRLFGARPYSIALYAEKDKVTNLSLVFANKGDLFSAKGSGEMHFDRDTPPAQAEAIVDKAMKKDIDAITTTISKVLGESRKERFGEGKVGRMNMQRWDWRGHSILLADAKGEYVGVQVVPSAFAEAGGKVARMSDAVVRERALSNVEKRPNGDVVVGDIPMVDQGPKGYCVPATAERAMRYLGVPADMYILANAGETGFGGGTSVELLLQGIGRHIKAKGRSFDSWNGPMKLRDLAKSIDRGVPVMWCLFSTDGFNKTADDRTAARKQVTDWAAWKDKVTTEAASNNLPKQRSTGHVVLIIGYNKDTNEIAFSDSWGERFTERWITIQEAEQVSQTSYYVIGF